MTMPVSLSAAPSATRLPDAVYALIAPLLALALTLASPAVLNDGDTWWHIAAGQWILAHRAVPTTDIFSFSAPGIYWNAHEWLAEILFAGAFKVAGWSGAVALTGALVAGTLLILTRRALRDGLSGIPLLALMLVGFSLIAPSLLVRPHLFGLFLLAFWVDRLMAARAADKAPPFWLAGVMLLWVNMHASFLLGLALIGPFALEALVEARADKRLKVLRGWALFGVCAALVCLINPQGFHTFVFPLTVMNLKTLGSIVEWRAMSFDHFEPMELALLALVGLALFRPVRVKPLRLVVLLGLIHMALHQGRHQMIFGIVAPLLLAGPMAAAFRGEQPVSRRDGALWRGGFALMALLAAVRLLVPLERVDTPTAPLSALAAVPQVLRDKPVLNELSFGGPLIYSGVKPFIDGRFDMYGDAFFFRYDHMVAGDAAAFDAGVAQYGFRWTLLPPAAPLNKVLAGRPEWKRIYGDDFAVAFARVD
ncbi:hypothetical protein CCR94_10970 [Rhodoblastus sphagnicola]|uniref:Glycosyltransferase RgtA/B/C/D-like domain-containing protein n=1 Tax=Rhodoblastus sphagnicola TaxID=333368 RepID=A0A2S6N8C8_9HYPH|nr:hypothetical protein [Rhodoblastus sphagnicola]MBB4198169.1 hypothetical protein [Rhodoblastus sphagnicola]PPQ30872.1 hypothetical protein CCR94_10970 [Rhodoblastus sphagnicola]